MSVSSQGQVILTANGLDDGRVYAYFMLFQQQASCCQISFERIQGSRMEVLLSPFTGHGAFKLTL